MPSVTHGSLGAGASLVGTPESSTIANKSLVAGSNISISSSSTEVTLDGLNAPTDSPICIIARTNSLAVTNGANVTVTWESAIYDPYGMWDNSQNIVIPEDGTYLVNLHIWWGFNAAGVDGTVSAVAVKDPNINLFQAREYVSGVMQQSTTCCGIFNFVNGDEIFATVNNSSGQNLNVSGLDYSPRFQVIKLRG